ncbi:hypothetical protein KDL44_10185 [bacterium]|nr:hypothetical protein [bacterium]
MTRMPLPLSLLLVLLLGAAALAQDTPLSMPNDAEIEGRAPADGPVQGGILTRALVGYRDELHDLAYAFPVGNAALGRAWATGRDIRWQVAHNYSVVPVLLKVENRNPSAQLVRIEVTSTHPYAREELHALGDSSPQISSRQLAVFSQEILVPPGLPSQVVVTPRYIPDLPPLSQVNLWVQTYIGDRLLDSEQLDVIVLDPAHLYYLHLDGAPGDPEELAINPGNVLQLAGSRRMNFDPSVLSTLMYGMSVERGVFTGAPLAARDFAFVCADAGAVADWPEDEQQALESFMLAGGRLCLYNMQDDWRGYGAGHDSNVGRGYLLAVPGDYPTAQLAMQDWVAGELEEFTLLCGGSVRGERLSGNTGDSVFAGYGLELGGVYGPDQLTGILPCRRPGWLHPVWLYRELSNDGATEPWDFPEYQLRRPRSSTEIGVGMALDTARDPRKRQQEALLDAAVPPRPWPWQLVGSLLLGFGTLLLLPARRGRRQWIVLLPLLLLPAAAWLSAQPVDFHPVRLQLLDRDVRSAVAASRRLSVLLSDSRGRSGLAMPPGALLRRVDWTPPGRFRQDGERTLTSFSGSGRAESVNLYSDSTLTELPDFPVRVELHQEPGRTRFVIDSSGLGPGQSCVLQTPLGYQLIRASQQPLSVVVSHAQLPQRPGLSRVQRIQEIHDDGANGNAPHAAMFEGMLSSLRRELSRLRPGSLSGICWDGLLRQPNGLLGANQNQAVLMVVDEQAQLTAGGVQEITVQRLCLPLGGSD